jgi:membrane-associated phospholipid phosphatase
MSWEFSPLSVRDARLPGWVLRARARAGEHGIKLVTGLRSGVTFSDYSARWAVIGVCAVFVASGLFALHVRVEAGMVPKLQFVGLLLLFSAVYSVIGNQLPRLRLPLAVVSDLGLSVVQVLVVTSVLLPLTYLAAATGFPLLDDRLAQLDALFGFDWDTAARWVANRPALDWVLRYAYDSMPVQGAAVLMIGSLKRPGDRNGEVIWLLIVSLLLTCAIFSFTPALGKIGHVGTGYLNVIAELRSGSWAVMSYHQAEGIITFPSFHTTLAIILTYAVRDVRWALAILVPLNILMVLSTPTVGGHYLVDLFGGAVVAAVSIAVVLSLRRRIARRLVRPVPRAGLQPSLSTG